VRDRGVVVITGGSAGVGRASARLFAERGHPVAVLARGQESLDATVAELEARGVPAMGVSVDVTDRAALDAAADRVEATLGPVAVWVNGAMVMVLGSFWDVEADDFDRVHDVIFRGTVNGTRTALRLMRPRNRGRIIEIGSVLSYRGVPYQAAYCSAKHAVQGLCDSLRAELLHEGSKVTISEVNLAAMNTPGFEMCKNLLDGPPQPIRPIYQPEVAAGAVVQAARTGVRSMNVTFTSTRSRIAEAFAPGVLDQVLGDIGYERQVDDRPRRTDPRDNLFAPLPGDHGCHGPFDEVALPTSLQEPVRRSPAGWAARKVALAARGVGAVVFKRVL
jgi:NAD(P)-dependent dehydrogenase (short-subunit alcohol dehydrogenase family)